MTGLRFGHAAPGFRPFCHAAFARARALPFALLADVHRTALRALPVLDAERNVAYRSTFVVDREGARSCGCWI